MGCLRLVVALALPAWVGVWLPGPGALREGPARPVAGPILVSAAVSLTEALREVASMFERAGLGTADLNLASSSSLARQILEGAAVDVFVSADAIQMDRVEEAGAVAPGSRIDLLSNELVIVVPSDRPVTLASAAALAEPRFRRIAVGDPAAVPAGVYARRYLESLGLWSRVAPKLVPATSVRGALAAAAAGSVDAAIVYRTDARASSGVRLALTVPRSEGPAIRYPGAVMRMAPHPEAARGFLDFLQGDEARAVFVRHGFVPIERP